MKKIKTEYLFDNSVVRIILDDGKGNVLDHVMMEDLQSLLESFQANNKIKLITFEGCTGLLLVSFFGDNPQLESIGEWAFLGCSSFVPFSLAPLKTTG